VLSLENTPPKSVVVVCLLDHPFLKSLRHKRRRRRRRRRRRTFFFVSKSNVKVVENNTTHMRKN
jgi:hypothetical protein